MPDVLMTLEELADRAVYLLRSRDAAWRLGRSGLTFDNDETERAWVASRRRFMKQLRTAVRDGDFEAAMMFFGNDSDAGFLFLEEALPFIPAARRSTLIADAWMHGRFGEHAARRSRRLRGLSLTIRAVNLLRAVPDLRPADWPEQVTVFRGVMAQDEEQARYCGLAPSWTLKREIAAWFASRGPEGEAYGWVLESTVTRADVLAYFDERHEAEVVVDAARLRGVIAGRLTDDDQIAVQALRKQWQKFPAIQS